MTTDHRPFFIKAGAHSSEQWLLPMMLLLAAGSGVAALIYEIVWFQLLELVIGSSAVSLGMVLATFMGGTGLGSLVFSRLVSTRSAALPNESLAENIGDDRREPALAGRARRRRVFPDERSECKPDRAQPSEEDAAFAAGDRLKPAPYCSYIRSGLLFKAARYRACIRSAHPLRVYAVIEILIGVFGIMVLLLMPLAGGVYTAWSGYGLKGFLLRGIVAAACLLFPTMLMGATLPSLARRVETTADGVSWLGFFYGANIGGAVFGCLLSGFYLLRDYDVQTATYVAAGVNAAVAALALALARVTTGHSSLRRGAEVRAIQGDLGPCEPRNRFLDATVYVAIALSGLCALAAEAIWTRMLGLLLGASVYTLSIILAVFLAGLGIGSSIGSLLCRTLVRPRLALGWCQLLVAGAIAWTAYSLAASLPYWPINPSISSDIWFNFQLDLDRAFWALLPPTLLWGASFPLALAALAAKPKRDSAQPQDAERKRDSAQPQDAERKRDSAQPQDAKRKRDSAQPQDAKRKRDSAQPQEMPQPSIDGARLVAGVYAANTLGGIAGALGASLLLAAWVGSQRTEQLLIAVSVTSGLLLLLPGALSSQSSQSLKPTGARWAGTAMGLVAALLGGGLLIRTVPPIAKLLVAHGRYAATWVGKGDIIYAEEGLNSSVAVSSFPDGVLTYHVAGKIQASNVPRDMRLQRMLGHLTTLTPANPRSVLVIGCGAGITAGAVSIDPRVERVTIVEIEPLVPQAASTYFSEHNFDVIRNRKVQVRIDDGRHYLLTTKERFDAITVDPLDPWVKGAANLYTTEFLDVVKQRLNPGGVVTMYIQLFETNLEAVKSSVATFFEVFPNGVIWGNTYRGQGHDMVLLGQVERPRIDLDEMEQRVRRPDHAVSNTVADSLREIGMNSPVDLFATYAGRKSDLEEWLKDAAINRDRNLRMQYLAGIALNLDDSAAIYAGMLAYRRFPEDLFIGAEGRVDSLREAIQSGQR